MVHINPASMSRTKTIAFEAESQGRLFRVRQKPDGTFNVWLAKVAPGMPRHKYLETYMSVIVEGKAAEAIKEAYDRWRVRREVAIRGGVFMSPDTDNAMDLYVAVMFGYCDKIKRTAYLPDPRLR